MSARRIWSAALALVLGVGGVVWWGLTGADAGTATFADPFGPAEEPNHREDTTVSGSTVVDAVTTVAETTMPVVETTMPVVETTAGVETTVAPTVPAAGIDTSTWLRCTAATGGWGLAYPFTWFVYTPTDGTDGCVLFGPTDLTGLGLEAASNASHVNVGRLFDVTLDAYRSQYIDAAPWEIPPVIESIDVAGRPALRYSAVLPAGIIDENRWGVKEYVVDLSHLAAGGVFYLQMVVPSGAEYDEEALIADAMASTLVLPST